MRTRSKLDNAVSVMRGLDSRKQNSSKSIKALGRRRSSRSITRNIETLRNIARGGIGENYKGDNEDAEHLISVCSSMLEDVTDLINDVEYALNADDGADFEDLSAVCEKVAITCNRR